MVRLFVAVNIPESLRRNLVAAQEKLPCRASLKLVEPENLHLTMKFLGETPPEKLESIKKILSEQVSSFAAFEVEVAGLGVFPNLQRARVIWAGVTKGRDEIVDLQRRIDFALSNLGFEPEQDFHPHVTLARVKSALNLSLLAGFIREMSSHPFGAFEVREVHLMQSTLTPKGPIYTKVFSAGLAEKDKPPDAEGIVPR